MNMEMPTTPSAERQRELNAKRSETLKSMTANGAEIGVNEHGDIVVTPTEDQIAAAHKEMEKALAGMANVEKHLEKVGKTVDITFRDPVVFDSILNRLTEQDRRTVIAVDLPVLRKFMGSKGIESAKLKEISGDDGYVTFDWQGKEYKVYGAIIEDISVRE